MESPQLVQYLRTGTIAPLKKGDSKAEVAANLGKPNEWAGRIKCFTWHEPPIADFRKSQGWWYGSLGVGFDTRGRLKSMSLDYTAIHGPTLFRPPFQELPATSFCLSDLIEMMDANHIVFEDSRGDRVWPFILTEGAVAVATLHGNISPKAQIIYLSHYAPKPYRSPKR